MPCGKPVWTEGKWNGKPAAEARLAGLKRFCAVLETTRKSACDRYVEPVMTELIPLLRLFWTEVELRFDPETLLPTALMRARAEEGFDALSVGTREQIALPAGLAFARMLSKSSVPAPIILDDAIVYMDDHRTERIFDAMTRQAHKLDR